MQQPKTGSGVIDASSSGAIAMRALMCVALLLLVTLSSFAQTQRALDTRRTFISPGQAVRIELKRPWTARPDIAGNNAARIYGADLTAPFLKFTVAEPNHRCSWLYTLALPIDVAKYPIAVLKYRAHNIDPKSVYTLRVDSDTKPQGVCRLFPGAELQSDGEIHEAKKDLREFNVSEPIALIGMGVESGNDGAGWVEVLDIRFEAPEGTAASQPEPDQPINVLVVDQNDKPIPHARVLSDSERQNFIRRAQTDENGQTTIRPIKNEADAHMLGVSAPGYAGVEVKLSGDENPVKVKLTPAKPYGGIAKVDGNPVGGAMVLATMKGDAPEGQVELRTYSTITDDAGRWLTPLLPADAGQISLTLVHPDGASVAKVDLDPKEAQAAATDVKREILAARVKSQTRTRVVSPEEGARILAQVRAIPRNGTAGCANAGTAADPPAQRLPGKSVVIQLARPFDPHPDFGGPDAADIYGSNIRRQVVNGNVQQSVVFTSGQPGKSVVFTYPLSIPIDITKYPIAVVRYRAKTINPNEQYTLRADYGEGGPGQVIRMFAGEEIKSDGAEHELKKDTRDSNVTDPINSIGIALQCSPDAGPATLEILEIRFDVPDDAPAAKVEDDAPIKVTVTDENDQPVKQAAVYVDYERRNFSRLAGTDESGVATVYPIKNEATKHSIFVQKDGFVASEMPEVAPDAGAITIKLAPGKDYGGVVKDENNKPVAGAMVSAAVHANPEPERRFISQYSTITDEKGRWLVHDLPVDPAAITISKAQLKEGTSAEEQIDLAEALQTGAAVAKEMLAEGNAMFAAAKAAPAAPTPAGATSDSKLAGKGAPAAAPATQISAAPKNQPLPAPEKAIVLNIHRPWLAGPMWDGNEPPKNYGENLDLPEPRFTVVDTNAKSFWVYKPYWPIDLSRYPILKLRYRARNTDAQNGYVLRLVQGDVLQLLKSEELKADGNIQEYRKDLRDVGGQRKLTNIGIWVNSGAKGNASFDLVEMSLSAPDDAPVEELGKGEAQTYVVTDKDNQPVAGAKVIVDAERANFAQSGVTDKDGKVRIAAVSKWVNFHMARVEKDGFYPLEKRLADFDNSDIELQLVPGTRYGGIARDANNKVLANAMIVSSGNPDLDNQTSPPPRSTVLSDSQGRWVTPILPALDGLTINLTPPGGGDATEVDLARAKDQGPELFAQLVKAGALASNMPTGASDEEKPSKEDKPTVGTMGGAPNIDVTVLKVDESTVGGKLTAMDGKQLTLRESSGSKQLPLADVQEITIKQSSSGSSDSSSSNKSGLSNAQIELAGDDHFKCSIKKWEEKKLTVQLAAAGSVTFDVPIDQARQLWIGTGDQIKKAQALNEKPGVEDIAYVAKDDQVLAVRGISLGVEGSDLKFRFNDQDRKIAVNRLVGITFGRSEDAPVDRSFHQSFQLGNDDVISGNWTALTNNTFGATTLWGAAIKLPVKQVAKIRAANGRVVYLSDLKPTQVEQVPFFDRILPFRVDKSLNGKPLQLSDGPVAKGIAVHSRTVLHYDLGAAFDEFRSKLGFQQPEGKLGDADVRVVGDGKVLFEKIDAKGDQPSTDINVKVAGVKQLVLEVDFGKNQDVGDRVVWGNARLLRAQLPQTSSASEGHAP